MATLNISDGERDTLIAGLHALRDAVFSGDEEYYAHPHYDERLTGSGSRNPPTQQDLETLERRLKEV